MSREYPTVDETIAYDDGFAQAEDYWRPKEQDRIIKLLEDADSACSSWAIALIKGEK